MGGLSVRPFSGWARNLEAVQRWQNAGAGGDSGMCRRSTDEAAGCWFTRGLGGMCCCLFVWSRRSRGRISVVSLVTDGIEGVAADDVVAGLNQPPAPTPATASRPLTARVALS